MNSKFEMISRFVNYYLKAETAYNVHSPYLFRVISHDFDTSKIYYPYKNIEILRETMLRSDKALQIVDFGAGSRVKQGNTRSLASIAKTSLSSVRQCRIMFSLAKSHEAKNILELGTCLGISALYLAAACPSANIDTIEADSSLAEYAQSNFKTAGYHRIHLHNGTFKAILPGLLPKLKPLDFVFLDGHHDKLATLGYFQDILPYCTNDCIMVVDDINWSKGMNEAWNQMKSHNSVNYSIDNFYFGVLFFGDASSSKKHIHYIDHKYKPWKIGLFG